MAIQVKNTKTLISPENLKLKVLIYAVPGLGKTSWAGTAPNPGIAACETGQGKGLLSIAQLGYDFCEPQSLAEFDEVCSGKVFQDKDTIVVDSLTSMVNTFIKEAALKIPRTRGDSDKRRQGIPELDDYGVMAELTRKLLIKLFALNKHIIVTATEKYKEPDAETGRGESLVGPELPGQLFLGAPAMFDHVVRMKSRTKLAIPNDAKSRIVERYLITGPDGSGTIAKSRCSVDGKPVLDKEEIVDIKSGQGTFPYLLDKILKGYGAK